MHTAVSAAHCTMVYYVVHNINFYNQKNHAHGFRPGTPTYHFRDHMSNITGSLFCSSNHQLISDHKYTKSLHKIRILYMHSLPFIISPLLRLGGLNTETNKASHLWNPQLINKLYPNKVDG